MNIKAITAAIGAAGMLAGLSMITAASASVTHQVVAVSSHRSLPKVQTNGMGGSWHRPGWTVRPGVITLGAEYQLIRIRWSSWTQAGAYGRGHLLACDAFTCERAPVKIHLWNVHRHSGPGRYFKDLKYTGRYRAFLHINGGVWA